MQLDVAQVRIRKRTPWQALDAGIVLARRWYRPLLAIWLACSLVLLPLLAGLAWIATQFLPGQTILWVFLFFWFLHPMVESALILWAGRAMFAARLSTRESLRFFRELCSFRFFFALLSYRLHPLRPFAYAVLVLEQPEQGQAAPRIALLGRGQENTAFFLTASLAITILLTISTVIALTTFIPEELRWFDPADFFRPPGYWLLFFLYALICALAAPFTVSCGFMLYISRRVELEAWDIELGFRNLNARLQAERR